MALLADMGELSEKTPDEAEVPNEGARRVRIGVYFYQDEVDV